MSLVQQQVNGPPLRVGIQGVAASFHDVAARKYFHDRAIEPVEFSSFQTLCDALSRQQTDFALMAIENSIAGSILPNYQLLEKHRFKIIGEVYQRIVMNIMAIPGQTIDDIRYVMSHPMAFLQCEAFFSRHPHLKRIEAADTAESAKEIFSSSMTSYAAIASQLAATTYKLNLLEEGIETDKQNYTRFLVISRGEKIYPDMPNKTSLRLELSHRPGALLAVLGSFDAHKLNMTKLQSVPILGRPYEYSFHIDLHWEDSAEFEQAMREIETKSINLIRFGEYQSNWKANS